MPLDLSMCRFTGPALPAPFVRFELEKELKDLLPKTGGESGRELAASWDAYRRHLRELVSQGGPIRVRNTVVEPLAKRLGYDQIEDAADIATREGQESGGDMLVNGNSRLRVWTTALGEDLDAPFKRGHAYRFSHLRIAQRVLLATNERVGLLTNGVELRILISDPARTDSQIEIPVESHWKRTRDVPDSYRLVLALCSPAGLKALPDLIDKARLRQTGVTKELRKQARQAVELFVQDLLNHPENGAILAEHADKEKLAQQMWFEGVINIFRMLFILKMESVDDPARAFSFASTSLWRNSFSPTVRLAGVTKDFFEKGQPTGGFLEEGLRSLYRMFTDGLTCTEINVKPLGGALFGREATPLLSNLKWGELAVAHLLDCLLWTPKQRGAESRERVHYGSLTVQDLGRVYESLIELEPGISTQTMCRLRRRKLEMVVPVAQGLKYKPLQDYTAEDTENAEAEEDEDVEEEDAGRGKKTKIEWIQEIPAGRFYLRVGLGRKTSGSHYTPDSFVKFLVRETLGPLCDERSPRGNPQPLRLLDIKVADIAMGSGHFLFESCEFLGDKLYEACRLCDELAMQEEAKAEKAKNEDERKSHLAKATQYRQRVLDLPDPNDELMAYLPSRAPEDGLTAYSVSKAQAICRRLVAVHCLYGVDLNPLAVDLAKLSLWIETHAEGLPLTFLDHRFVVGDSLSGPSFEHLLKFPGTQQPIEDLLSQGIRDRFTQALQAAMREVRELEATVGTSLGEIEAKKAAKARMDQLLAPFKLVAAAWTGGVMVGAPNCDDQGYATLVKAVSSDADARTTLEGNPRLQHMVAKGQRAVPFDLVFPDVFFRAGDISQYAGFDVVLGNPPWDRMLPADKEFFATFDFNILNAPTLRERKAIQQRLEAISGIQTLHLDYLGEFRSAENVIDTLYKYQIVMIDGEKTIGKQDLFRLFMERNTQLMVDGGCTGVVVPSAFHANEGATGVRRLYLEQMAMRCCYSFENKRKLFDIHRSFKFALVVAGKPGPTIEFPCGFYLHDDEWLFGEEVGRALVYSLDFVRKTGGPHLSLLELRSKADAVAASTCYRSGEAFGIVCNRHDIRFGRELNMTDDSWRFTATSAVLSGGEDPRDPGVAKSLLAKGYLVLHEGKTLWHYDDRWVDRPVYCVAIGSIGDKQEWLRSACFFRPAYRAIASSTNERTIVFSLMPPGCVFGNSAPPCRNPMEVRTSQMLELVALVNTFAFDWTARVRVGGNINQFILFSCPVAKSSCDRFYSHTALRLSCNHAGYAPLWTEQLGDTWREPKSKHTWPVLEGDGERWVVRAAIDAVVADAYGLTREQYAHVLSTFSHKSYPKAPELCLARFDELKSIGLDAFTKKHDPYWDTPLNEALPKPVIELPPVSEEGSQESGKKPRRRKAHPGMVREGTADYGPLFGRGEQARKDAP